MDREEVIAKLRAHQQDLLLAGVRHLALFGSTARGEARHDSDVDLLATFDETRRLSLLDVVGIELQLQELLGCPVDLSEQGTLKPRVQQSIEAEAVVAF